MRAAHAALFVKENCMKKSLIFFLGVLLMMQNGIKAESAPTINLNHQIKVCYTNYRGETAIRSIIPIQIYWGKTDYHPHEQWLLEVFDVERNDKRIYAFKDIKEILD